jgi:hypothetical protein
MHWYPDGDVSYIPSGAERYIFVHCAKYILVVPCSIAQVTLVVNRLNEVYNNVEVSTVKPTIKGDYLIVEASEYLR